MNLSTKERQYWSVISTVTVPRWIVFFPKLLGGGFNSQYNISQIVGNSYDFFYGVKYDTSKEMWNSWMQVEMFLWEYRECFLYQVCRVKFTTLLTGFVGSNSVGSSGGILFWNF